MSEVRMMSIALEIDDAPPLELERLVQVRAADLPPPFREFYGENLMASHAFVVAAPGRDDWFRRHCWWPFAELCLDGRVQDIAESLGLRVGILEIFRSGGARQHFSQWGFNRRVLDCLRKARQSRKRVALGMVGMNFATVHFSASNPHPELKQGCARWEHKTKRALEYQVRQSAKFNAAFPGMLLSLPLLIDTDTDAVQVFGPGGAISILDLLDDPRMHNGRRFEFLLDSLKKIFPMTWHVLARFSEPYRLTFHRELAELLDGNYRHAVQVRESGRPPELLDHKETVIFVGRHADVMVGFNKMCIVDDVNGELSHDFGIELKYVSRQVIREAYAQRLDCPIIPVAINVPYDGEDDRVQTIHYAAELQRKLRHQVRQQREHVVAWLEAELGAEMLASSKVQHWLKHLPEFVYMSPSTSLRSDRLYVPFTLGD